MAAVSLVSIESVAQYPRASTYLTCTVQHGYRTTVFTIAFFRRSLTRPSLSEYKEWAPPSLCLAAGARRDPWPDRLLQRP